MGDQGVYVKSRVITSPLYQPPVMQLLQPSSKVQAVEFQLGLYLPKPPGYLYWRAGCRVFPLSLGPCFLSTIRALRRWGIRVASLSSSLCASSLLIFSHVALNGVSYHGPPVVAPGTHPSAMGRRARLPGLGPLPGNEPSLALGMAPPPATPLCLACPGTWEKTSRLPQPPRVLACYFSRFCGAGLPKDNCRAPIWIVMPSVLSGYIRLLLTIHYKYSYISNHNPHYYN